MKPDLPSDLPPRHSPHPPQPDAEPPRAERERLRAMIIGALAAGGAFQLNGWQVQAHGNRSSHSVASVQQAVFRPDDYILMRQQYLAPSSDVTVQLAQVTEQLRTLQSQPVRIEATDQFNKLVALKAQIEEGVHVGPTTAKALRLLRAQQVDEAIAAIEGEGSPECILNAYLWALLDLGYLGRRDGKFTADHIAEFGTVAKWAVAYSEKVLSQSNALGPLSALAAPQASMEVAARTRVAEIYHNIASFTLPEDGIVPPELLAQGRDAAQRALKLRRELGQPYETVIALLTVGKHAVRANDTVEAKRLFTEAVQQAEKSGRRDAVAWAKAYLARVIACEDPDRAAGLNREVDQIINQTQESCSLLEALRIERQVPSAGADH
jgi:hypothetical protein